MKLAESLSLITKKIKEVDKSTQNLGENNNENSTPQLAIEITQTELPIEIEQKHPL